MDDIRISGTCILLPKLRFDPVCPTCQKNRVDPVQGDINPLDGGILVEQDYLFGKLDRFVKVTRGSVVLTDCPDFNDLTWLKED